MEKLYVLYDPKCELCCRLKNWILVQRSWLGIAVVEQGSEKAKRLFPELDRVATKEDLAVISDEGAVYLNDRAWIMAMYAMVEYRDWARRLTHPLLMPLARQAFAALSKNRHWLSKMLNSDNVDAIAVELRKVELEPCALPGSNAQMSTVREYLQ
ncbi:MAG TPA: DCC1-like thiol-disulfide oxidoreductase family protein [Candidatus Sulfotelmatobacter sp.]|nr:DCC1-like thiol-disulfide oxidoreductase family protein [Candidatus Sulfotelmatobacter sp.]